MWCTKTMCFTAFLYPYKQKKLVFTIVYHVFSSKTPLPTRFLGLTQNIRSVLSKMRTKHIVICGVLFYAITSVFKAEKQKRWLRYCDSRKDIFNKIAVLNKKIAIFRPQSTSRKIDIFQQLSLPPVHRTQNMARWQNVLNCIITTEVEIVFTNTKMDIFFTSALSPHEF